MRSIVLRPLLGVVMVASVGCGPGLDHSEARCRDVDCSAVPAPDCLDGRLRSYKGGGRCELNTGLCTFDFEQSNCEFGCFDASRCRVPGDLLGQVETGELLGASFGDGVLAVDRQGRVYAVRKLPIWWENYSAGLVAITEDGVVDLSEVVSPQFAQRASPVAVSGADVLVASERGKDSVGRCRLERFSASGERLWRQDLDHCHQYGAPATDKEDNVYLATQHNPRVYLQKSSASGEKRWRVSVTIEGVVHDMANPIVDGLGRAYLAVGQTVVAFDAEGNERWRAENIESLSNAFPRQMALFGETLFAPSKNGVYALSLDRGETRWRYETDEPGQRVQAPPVVDDAGRVLLGLHDGDSGRLTVLDPDGRVADHKELVGLLPSRLIVLEDGSYVLSAVDATTTPPAGVLQGRSSALEERWTTRFGIEAADVVVDAQSRIIAYLRGRGLLMLQAPAPLATSGWPCMKGGYHGAGRGP